MNKRPPDLRNGCCQLRLGLVRCRSQKRQDMGNTAGIRRCLTVIGVFGAQSLLRPRGHSLYKKLIVTVVLYTNTLCVFKIDLLILFQKIIGSFNPRLWLRLRLSKTGALWASRPRHLTLIVGKSSYREHGVLYICIIYLAFS